MPRLSYVGIKQIGSYWFSKKDNYLKNFDTADECSRHFNKEKTILTEDVETSTDEKITTKKTTRKKGVKNEQ